ncbi:FUSC family protein [Streptomyces sp. AV19]|uniref:FUSC family protein n=1 Tax=Streptomyces sp. AV19 TaxID=2793068 RepID=UPI0018FEFDD4|nr:FUSC family protein [Streptomyces sp. AV19]MBH1933004.1 FUSC family protein [Streptomyces sp. AV19]MDG4531716.1 FUSC family protein [Streptomyces sp. AV19]
MIRPVEWLLRQPDGPQAVRRAVWVVLAGCPGFYVLNYVLHEQAMAMFAVFGALPLVLFCKLPGPPLLRARTLLLTLPAGLLAVTAGTLLAAHDWAAALGLFAVGFVVSFLGAGGPRPTAVAAALQLYYVLPCFPPYVPGQLGDRLAGLTIGFLLTIAVDLLLWRDPLPVPYRTFLADATDAVAGYCAAAARLLDGAGDGDPPAVREAALRTDRALEATLLSRVPPDSRPASVSLRDRGLNHTRAALGHLRTRLDGVAVDAHEPDPRAAHLLQLSAAALRRTTEALRSGSPARTGPADELADGTVAFDEERARRLGDAPSPEQLRQDATVRAVAEGVLVARQSARIALGDRLDPRRRRPTGPFAYATVPSAVWWWRRLSVHLTPRSVLLRNALRIAVALACARVVAGELSLPHGFWVLLATLSLMRTSAADTRAALLPAFAGTALGALVSVGMLEAVGERPPVYAVLTPFVFLLGFSFGTVAGPMWSQAVMTLAFMVLFGQVSYPGWDLPAFRFVDIIVGGLIGAAAGLLAWPRGAYGQLRDDVGEFLVRAATGCRAVAERLCHVVRDDGSDVLLPARRAMLLAQATHLEYTGERAARQHRSTDPSWGTYMLAGYDVVTGGALLLGRHRSGDHAPPAPEATAELTALAERVAGECVRAARALSGPGSPGPASDPNPARASGPLRLADRPPGRTPAADVLLMADAEAWLTAVARDAVRARGAG